MVQKIFFAYPLPNDPLCVALFIYLFIFFLRMFFFQGNDVFLLFDRHYIC